MPRSRPRRESAQQMAEEYLPLYMTAVEHENDEGRRAIAHHVVQACGAVDAADALLNMASRYRAEGLALKTGLEKKDELLRSLLAEPRRIDQVLGLIRDPSDDGETVWAVLKGPPTQAVLLQPDLTSEDICPDDPAEPVWVWLVNGSNETLVVAGRIEPPSLLLAGVEKEMVFQGFVDTGENGDGE